MILNSILKFLHNHLDLIARKGIYKYILIVATELTIFSMTILMVANLLNFHSTGSFLDGENSESKIFLYIVVIVPLIETALFQLVPTLLIRKYSLNIKQTAIIYVLPFALMHSFPFSIPSIVNSVLCGALLGFSFLIFSKKSFHQGFVVTFLIHCIHNLAITTIWEFTKI